MKNSIRVERAKVRETQQDLADAVKVSRQSIFAIENGKYVPSTTLAMKITRHFGVRVEDIFTLEEED